MCAGGLLERRTGGEFWRLLGAAPARRPFTAGLVRPALRSRRPRAGSPWQSPRTRFASACRSRVSLTTFLAALTERTSGATVKPQARHSP